MASDEYVAQTEHAEKMTAHEGVAETHESTEGGGISVSLAAERLGHIAGIPITNTLLMSWVVMVILITVAFLVGRRIKLVPSRLQLFFEEVITYVHNFMRETLENDKVARRYLPLLLTLFLFIALANLLEFTPGIGHSIGFYQDGHLVPLLRSMNTDLNVTLAFAIISVIVIEIAGVMALGFWRYAGKFLNFSSPVNFAVGLIELVSEVSRLVTFSFRLFGNIFAGEVLLAVVAFFVPYVLPAPLMAFELFVGVLQAAVFSLLTLFFIKLAITDMHEAH
ncbi:ATP synthase F0 subunit A [Candidatus Parcubacteria bacterium]|nr:MAG: ATP synthase F0 subunit A [Candidatus Parcubacteria bacterium]